ncbi:MAG: aldehyde ferredoxin oxidoreductase C-terminal domain-containing protein [Actinomycetota bacterium]|nr:aldehyde ferredoxin oxidoreductase C-terminal domain-containing protein [Actinomycetota bacterium]
MRDPGRLRYLCYNSNLVSVAKANELCNRLGMDTITCGATIAWAMEAFEKGALTLEETDGLELNWGDAGLIVDLLEKIARGGDARRDALPRFGGRGERAGEGQRAMADHN